MEYSKAKLPLPIVEKIARLSYFAGIIDGEGSIGIEHLSPTKGRVKDYYNCRLTVINTSQPLMELLVNFFKGSYDQRKKLEGRKKCYRWHVFGEDLENALKELLPHLFLKQEQAKLVLQYRETVGKTGWNVTDEVLAQRKNLWLKCKLLNSVGDLPLSSPLSSSPEAVGGPSQSERI